MIKRTSFYYPSLTAPGRSLEEVLKEVLDYCNSKADSLITINEFSEGGTRVWVIWYKGVGLK